MGFNHPSLGLGKNIKIRTVLPTKLLLNGNPMKAKSVSCGYNYTMIVDRFVI
jgi:hypothetical protein